MAITPVTAVILAAGRSTRMEQFKPLLPIGNKPVIERCLSMFKNAGIRDMRVVIGHLKDQMEPVLKKAGAGIIVNRNDSPEMFSSVCAALKDLEAEVQSIALLPGDVPLVRPWTVYYLLKKHAENPQHILVPGFQGKRGHPVIIPEAFFGLIRSWDGHDGLRGVFKSLSDHIMDIPVGDANIRFDMDSPEDYEEAKERWLKFSVPGKDECLSILRDVFNVDETIISHCGLVADMAGKICDALVQNGYRMDRNIITAAGFLHDMAKGSKDHEKKAADLLREMGFPGVASIVADHTDLDCSDRSPINPSEVLYLADKLVDGTRRVTVDERFQGAMDKFGHDPEVRKKIERRMNHARIIMKKVRHSIGETAAQHLFSF